MAGFRERVRVPGDPVADPAAQVVVDRARFTVLTDRLLRLEWAPDGEFEDRGTYAFPNRRAAVPPFEVRGEGGATVIDTGPLLLRHTPDGRPLHAGNTSVELTGPVAARWVPGLRDPGNLGGARRTVDGCRGEAALEPGLASRSGWALVDDSAGFLFSTDGWVEARREHEDLQDWYFFGHGHDYAAAVADYTRFGGRVPVVPRWVLGAWWSRYWPYSADDVRALVGEFRARDLPLDVFVLDMDWHTTHSWTGYSWNRELFPDPRGFLEWLHGEGLHTTLNLHPALGVQAFEDAYPEFARAMGVDPAGGEALPFRIADPEFARHYFELLHHPLEDEGVDFWWIDWQQGRTSELRGLDPLPWLNHLHFADAARRAGRRPLIFSRWGGLGSHRYPIGFSGDSYALWSALRFQPRYTAAGANVAYAWWSHDIGGHFGADAPELYARWVQFGALSPVLRLHSQQGAGIERAPWMFGAEVLEAARAAFHLRYSLVPYLYSGARVVSEEGVAVVRPLSWVAPEREGAYLARYQYMLGEALLAAPVMHPAEPSSGLATVDAWLPDGDWLERTTGERFTGPRWVRLVADLTRIPQFVRPGTILPLAEVAPTTAAQPADHLILSVFPGADGVGRVYDDESGWTTVRTAAPDAASCSVTIEPAGARRHTVRLEGTVRPARVTVDGMPARRREGDEGAAAVGALAGRRHEGEAGAATVGALADWRHEGETTFVEIPAGATTVHVCADGPLSARGPEHDRVVRVGDLRRLLGAAAPAADDALDAAVRALPADHPGRAAAIARIGGPAIQVFDHTAPDEAEALLGRVVAAAPETGPPAQVEVRWTLERRGRAETTESAPVEVAPLDRRDTAAAAPGPPAGPASSGPPITPASPRPGTPAPSGPPAAPAQSGPPATPAQSGPPATPPSGLESPAARAEAAVLDAPFAWDGTAAPARWSVDVTVRWGDVVLTERHVSPVLIPALTRWRAVVLDADDPPPTDQRPGWTTYEADPRDADFASLADGYVLPLWRDAEPADAALVAYATTTLDLPEARELAFEYRAGGPVRVHVDGSALDADVDGAGPVPNGTLHPWTRRTAPVRLTPGQHSLRFTCEKPADLAPFHLYLSVSVVDPAGEPVLLELEPHRGIA